MPGAGEAPTSRGSPGSREVTGAEGRPELRRGGSQGAAPAAGSAARPPAAGQPIAGAWERRSESGAAPFGHAANPAVPCLGAAPRAEQPSQRGGAPPAPPHRPAAAGSGGIASGRKALPRLFVVNSDAERSSRTVSRWPSPPVDSGAAHAFCFKEALLFL